jgi:hypothetical protein
VEIDGETSQLNCTGSSVLMKRVSFVIGFIVTSLLLTSKDKIIRYATAISSILVFGAMSATYLTAESDRPWHLGYFTPLSQIGIAFALFHYSKQLKRTLLKLYTFYIFIISIFWVGGYNAHFTILGLSQNSIWTVLFLMYFLILFLDLLQDSKMSMRSKLLITAPLLAISFYSSGRGAIILAAMIYFALVFILFKQKKQKLGLIALCIFILTLFLPTNTYGPRLYRKKMCEHHLAVADEYLGFSTLLDNNFDPSSFLSKYFKLNSLRPVYSDNIECLKLEDYEIEGEFNFAYNLSYFRKYGLQSPRFEMWWIYLTNQSLNSFLFGNDVIGSPWLESRKYEKHSYNHHNFLIETHKKTGLLGVITVSLLFLFSFISLFQRSKFFSLIFLVFVLRALSTKFLLFSPYFFVFLVICSYGLLDKKLLNSLCKTLKSKIS